MMAEFAKYYLVCFVGAFALIVFVLPSLRVRLRTGRSPLTFSGGSSAHDLVGRWMKLVFALLGVAAIVPAFFSSFYLHLEPLSWLEDDILLAIGLVLIHAALVWIVIAQFHMGLAWRIGIDTKQSELVQTGPFRLSRNPVFLGLIVGLLGFFFIMPNALTLLVFVTGGMLMSIQVRLEEEFLERKHGEQYREYRSRVRRWL